MAQSFDFNEVIENFKKVVTTQYFCFDGRMGKREYWMYMIPAIILTFIPFVGQVIALALLLPILGATARRLHDVGKTGWLQLFGLVCGIGYLIVLFLCIPDGDPNANDYGEAPVKSAE